MEMVRLGKHGKPHEEKGEIKMDMDIFFADNTPEPETPDTGLFLSLMDFLPDMKAFFLCLFVLSSTSFSADITDAQDFPTPLIETQPGKGLQIDGREKVQKMWQRTNELARLHDGWDGNDSLGIKPETIARFKQTLNLCDDKDVTGWTLFPQAEGKLYLDFTSGDRIAGITLSEDEAVYFKGTIHRLIDTGTFEPSPTNLYRFIHDSNAHVQKEA